MLLKLLMLGSSKKGILNKFYVTRKSKQSGRKSNVNFNSNHYRV